MDTLKRVGLVGRFKPLHKGAAQMLDCLCNRAEHVIIGVGSANKYDARNPFTPYETQEMIDRYLAPNHDNYEFRFIDDHGHCAGGEDGAPWREEVLRNLGSLDLFVTGNPYVRKLLADHYGIITPEKVIRESYVPLAIKGAAVRNAMARDGGWKVLVPRAVADYIVENGLDERVRREFGPEIIAYQDGRDLWRRESLEEERTHIIMRSL